MPTILDALNRLTASINEGNVRSDEVAKSTEDLAVQAHRDIFWRKIQVFISVLIFAGIIILAGGQWYARAQNKKVKDAVQIILNSTSPEAQKEQREFIEAFAARLDEDTRRAINEALLAQGPTATTIAPTSPTTTTTIGVPAPPNPRTPSSPTNRRPTTTAQRPAPSTSTTNPPSTTIPCLIPPIAKVCITLPRRSIRELHP